MPKPLFVTSAPESLKRRFAKLDAELSHSSHEPGEQEALTIELDVLRCLACDGRVLQPWITWLDMLAISKRLVLASSTK